MSTSADERDRLTLFKAVWKAHETRRAVRRAELAELVKQTPLSDELVKEIAFLGSKHEAEVMRNHPGYEAHDKLRGLRAMLQVFRRAHSDLNAALDHFDEFSTSTAMIQRAGKPALDEIRVSVHKEMLAFSTAAAALRTIEGQLRSLLRLRAVAEQIAAIFDPEEHQFIVDLRNVIAHRQLPNIGWQIQWREQRSTDFIVDGGPLLALDKLQAPAKTFIRRCGEQIHVRAVANSYAARIEQFYGWFDSTLEANVPPTLAEYRRCRQTSKAVGSRSWYRIVLTQALAGKVDPYKHLDKYLLPAQIEAAMRLQHGSREQVDFIIATADEHGACDDELRRMIYELFGVT